VQQAGGLSPALLQFVGLAAHFVVRVARARNGEKRWWDGVLMLWRSNCERGALREIDYFFSFDGS
jgi:hypothetical protein